MRLRSRTVNCSTGSIPALAMAPATTRLERCALAVAPSVTLTASATSLSGRQRSTSAAASVVATGEVSAVTENCPARSTRSSRPGDFGAVCIGVLGAIFRAPYRTPRPAAKANRGPCRVGRGPVKKGGDGRVARPLEAGGRSAALRRQLLLVERGARHILERNGHRLGAAIDLHLAEELHVLGGRNVHAAALGMLLEFHLDAEGVVGLVGPEGAGVERPGHEL